ncbi:hypothetical protein CcaverHIS002_0401720 [Cutaneotrichosporon cavernicola]|uniref:SH3 domain-containing protein n=1 Tax=Cutaneotrichosporon cavernicola TaxID=279322 RepID=A0AA48L3N8_9TREE|nr:uncharacterized protein CcaverHIS019_0401680 [Cutaneotrichosporon cavernicola]BEI83568.1 hypothetical protein CcaverHIS002_0401720 [Cutaneotrichosporon cavernicola]BEI91348.1 hypothetical protein CcaverHIS019_0401680 [Cutaneotrichosporon cavernicola]BEI99121.1 hypothetical protein CcaverHIS631_0401640 [Cutaneotrichosporon cavernicola]BEJ06895.1 hypothetical protein CcaverHIS641_0401640 [Cutaneotrichosporon cavernicola]
MFSNLSWQDKQAFFALLDEYFESRPHLRPDASAGASSSASAPPVSFSSRPSSRPTPPAAPVRTGSNASGMSSPPEHSGAAATGSAATTGSAHSRQLGQAKGAFNDGMHKVTNNSTIKAGLGKVGAGGLAHKFGGGSTFKPTGNVPGPGERNLPPAPTRSVVGPPPQRNFGSAKGDTGAWASESQQAAPAPVYNSAGSARAVYDFDGGDANDLPLRAGEVVTIVAKTSPDWWTCRNAEGREGLVPGNYMTEL